MSKLAKVAIPLAIILVGVVGAVVLVKARPEVGRDAPELPAPLVRAMTARPGDAEVIVTSQGTVHPRTETVLVAEVSGRIIRVTPSFESGALFSEGQTLLQIDPIDYESAVVQARSAVAQAELLLAQQEAEAAVARDEWADLEQSEASPLASRELHVAQARANFEAAKARLRQAERNLDRTRIRAPYKGRVRQRTADVGQFVAPGAQLGVVFATDYAEVRLPVSDSDLAFLDLAPDPSNPEGPEVILRGRFAGEDRSWSARVVRVEGEIDPQTRMVHLVARIDDPYRVRAGSAPLSMGLFVEAEIGGSTLEDVLVIPRSALRSGDRVVIVDTANRLRERRAEVLRVAGDRAFLRAETEPGEKVCLTRLDVFVDGMEVRVRDEDPLSVPRGEATETGTVETPDRAVDGGSL